MIIEINFFIVILTVSTDVPDFMFFKRKCADDYDDLVVHVVVTMYQLFSDDSLPLQFILCITWSWLDSIYKYFSLVPS